ncbi:hypothetical protein BGZ63DRAFT_474273 [Mariannaea sp. PMI_226]|nr:hypothetical protein BGZ63DRAFT_474273 [Mariannaea sp. PMI_226]
MVRTALQSKVRRIRHSCERCRQKKTKCPAEKPICSFCRRLNQTCIYLPRRNPDAASKTTTSLSKDLPPTNCTNTATNLTATSPNALPASQAYPATWHATNPEPGPDVLDHLVDVYREKIYFQPLPLFNLHHLRDQLLSFPYYLRWGLLALSIHYTKHSFYRGNEDEAVEYYTTSSRSMAMELSTEGTAQIDVLQLLCLLALCEIMEGQHSRAWMTIGTASRLEALRMSSVHYPSNDAHTSDTISRCHWSIVMLEKIFTPNFSTLSGSIRHPDFPPSPTPPTPLGTIPGGKSYHPGLSDAHEMEDQNQGVNACSLYVTSTWGDIISYLRDIREGLSDCPWLPTSRYSKLAVKFYETEMTLSRQHLLRHVSFPDRLPSDIADYREYWNPWVLTQIVSHAAKAALDNPFIQLVAHRSARGVTQPRSFLQHSVDQALFNYQWVARLLQMCEDVQFTICDPLIGHAVAATATIPWLFQFARDDEVATKAKENLKNFEIVLAQLSSQWPHIAHKLRILQKLQLAVQDRQQDVGTEVPSIRFQPELLWELLDPNLPPTTSLRANSSQPGLGDHNPTSATLHVTTTFTHPVADQNTPVDRSSSSDNVDYLSQQVFDDLEGQFLDDFLSDSFLSGMFY